MRIALVGPLHPYRGGIAHYGAALDEVLRVRGHETLRVNYSRLYPGFLFPGKTQYDEGPGGFVADSERRIDSLLPWTWIAAAGRILEWRADAAVLHSWHPFFAPALTAISWRLGRNGVPVVLLCHNVLPHESSRFDRALLRGLYGSVRRCIVPAVTEEAAFRKIGGGEAIVRMVPHPAYDLFARRFPPIDRAEARGRLGVGAAKMLLFFGYVRPYKGLRVLIDAMPRVLERADAELLVAGEFYEDIEPHRARVRALGLTERVRLVDRYVPNPEVGVLFGAADLVVVPYVEATQSGVAQLAVAYGVPALVTRAGGLAGADDAGGLIRFVPAADPHMIAAGILECLIAPSARHDPIGTLSPGWTRLAEAVEDLSSRS